jgi:hypothetical protein
MTMTTKTIYILTGPIHASTFYDEGGSVSPIDHMAALSVRAYTSIDDAKDAAQEFVEDFAESTQTIVWTGDIDDNGIQGVLFEEEYYWLLRAQSINLG